MIILESYNRIIEGTLSRAIDADKFGDVEITVADFDGVTFHLSTGEDPSKLRISAYLRCWDDLKAAGAEDVLREVYGDMLVEAEEGNSVSILIDLAAARSDKEAVVAKAAALKQHCMGAPLRKAFADMDAGKADGTKTIELKYREDESIFVRPKSAEECQVFYSILFRDADDIVIAKTFLQEFVDARRNLNSAPAVSYSARAPPVELAEMNLPEDDARGYVTFVLFKNHTGAAQRAHATDMLLQFRDYLQYHIKCSKAYLHTRMRARVADFLKILNRARPEVADDKKAKKTASGKTFARK